MNILHPLRVMLAQACDKARMLAVLHDVVEDCGVNIEDLRREGFTQAVLDGILSVTKQPGESYSAFVARAGANELGSERASWLTSPTTAAWPGLRHQTSATWPGWTSTVRRSRSYARSPFEDRKATMDRDIHPAETSLFVAAALRRLRLSDAPGGCYRVEREVDGQLEVVAGCASFQDVAHLCGAAGAITLRQAAERDGLSWPDSAEAFVAAVKDI
jgi:hypothetical protein